MAKARCSRTALATLGCAALFLPACEGRCQDTDVDAYDAALVDTGQAGSSAVLEARLTAGGKVLAGRTVVFLVRTDGGSMEFAGSVATDSNGVAQLDLKDDLVELAEDATGDSFRAVFHGDGRYCASRDEADLDLVAVP